MNEIEVKILGVNPKEIKKKLKKLGARTVFENRLIHARCYDFPDKSVRKSGDHIRLRKVGKKVEITFKHLKARRKYKNNEEVDVPVDDFNAMHKFFLRMGLVKYADYRKKRSRYTIGKYQYEIDKYPGIPHFVEVEVKSNDVKKAVKELEKAVKLLGYTMADTKPWNAFEMHEHYKKKI